MLDFILAYWKILLTVYLIGAALTFAATGIFLLWTGKKEEEEREKYPEYYENMDNIGRWGYCIIVLVVSILVGIMWVGLPVVLAGALIFDWIMKKYPKLWGQFGNTEEDEREETEK